MTRVNALVTSLATLVSIGAVCEVSCGGRSEHPPGEGDLGVDSPEAGVGLDDGSTGVISEDGGVVFSQGDGTASSCVAAASCRHSTPVSPSPTTPDP